ncbi:hypothetical protein HII36_39825 [Nonomuraea sp. NN258]|uniref:hypothetical protein n=1 Tax=Nonomuraea antri TaxID=2730852 RepID=UPI001568275D|nr:hypothetical protein [Nonomuraea antri]NRQ37937.1 hypothetical protein [Nonomuraea antri]
MKRIIAGLALATSVALVTSAAPASATPAPAAPKDPVAAVKKQLVPGKGVKFTERTTIIDGDERSVFVRRSGMLRFSRSGIAASDITAKSNLKASEMDEDAPDMLKAMAKPERTIKIGNTAYVSGGILSASMPEGSTWFKMPKGPHGGMLGMYGQPVNIAEPATLKALLQTGKPTRDGYSGKITVGALYKVSPWYRSMSILMIKPSVKQAKNPISWRLSVNAKGLPIRLVTTFASNALGPSAGDGTDRSVDTRYTGWGGKITIKAPPADQVTDELND